jgi:hypothetical protein
MNEISIKIGDIEARICKDFTKSGKNSVPEYEDSPVKYEIVKWKHKMDGSYCFVIAFITTNSETPEDDEIRAIPYRLHDLTKEEYADYNKVMSLLLKFIYDKDD